jgi:hypothetical protein
MTIPVVYSTMIPAQDGFYVAVLGQTIIAASLGNYVNDAAAAAGGVPVNGIYRNGSVLMVRVV